MAKLKLDKERNLFFDSNAMVSVEEAVGKTAFEIISGARMGFRETRAFLWAGLRHEDPRLTIEAAGDLLTSRNLSAIAKAINEAIVDFFGPKN